MRRTCLRVSPYLSLRQPTWRRVRQVSPLGGGRRPIFEPLGQLRGVRRERMRRHQVDGAIRAALAHDVARAETDRAHRRRVASGRRALTDVAMVL